jgi:K+-transporting ATPase ATPase C chain
MRLLIYRAVMATIILVLVTGVAYPLAVTGVAQVLFKEKADGSMIYKNGQIVGAKLIGQNFSLPQYFHPSPSAAGKEGYDAAASSGSNLGPTNAKLIEGIKNNIKKVQAENPGVKAAEIPVDLVTASGSGLDPHISPAAALLQVPRVAESRHLSEETVKKLVDENTEERQLGVLGEPRVNVLLLNFALDEIDE